MRRLFRAIYRFITRPEIAIWPSLARQSQDYREWLKRLDEWKK